MNQAACLHCDRQRPTVRRRLCYSCYNTRAIRHQYPSHSKFQATFPALVGRGLLVKTGDTFQATESGAALAQPTVGASLNDWLAKLKPSEAKALRALADAYPERLTREQVAERTGQSVSSSTFQAAFPALRDLELIEGRSDFRTVDELMQ
jgi:hypothetical protein